MKRTFTKEIRELCIHDIVFIILIVVSIFSYIFYTNIRDTKMNWQNNTDSMQDLEFNVLKTGINEEICKAHIQTELVSEIITKDILNGYKNNIPKLESDLSVSDPDLKVYGIINKDILDRYINKDNQNNRIFVTLNNKILSTSFSPNNNFKKQMSIYNFYNKAMNNKNLNKLLVNKDEYTILNMSGEDFDDIDGLKQLYLSKGLDGLKDINILVASYITKDGDIFGVNDRNSLGEIQSNNKIIVIQQINIYDAMKLQSSLTNDFIYTSKLNSNQYMHEINMAYVRNYVLLSLVIIISLIAVGGHNR